MAQIRELSDHVNENTARFVNGNFEFELTCPRCHTAHTVILEPWQILKGFENTGCPNVAVCGNHTSFTIGGLNGSLMYKTPEEAPLNEPLLRLTDEDRKEPATLRPSELGADLSTFAKVFDVR